MLSEPWWARKLESLRSAANLESFECVTETFVASDGLKNFTNPDDFKTFGLSSNRSRKEIKERVIVSSYFLPYQFYNCSFWRNLGTRDWNLETVSLKPIVERERERKREREWRDLHYKLTKISTFWMVHCEFFDILLHSQKINRKNIRRAQPTYKTLNPIYIFIFSENPLV